jgi:hypothetical protein
MHNRRKLVSRARNGSEFPLQSMLVVMIAALPERGEFPIELPLE